MPDVGSLLLNDNKLLAVVIGGNLDKVVLDKSVCVLISIVLNGMFFILGGGNNKFISSVSSCWFDNT
jgi:hypothetical protein